MLKQYKRKAKLLDDGILLKDYVCNRRFYPIDSRCGFSYQIIRKKDVGIILFYD